jgi:superfamily II DNA helicase RecQ
VPADEVKDLLNVLADAGLIERHGIEGGRPGAFVLALTPEGRRVAKGQDRPELALPTVPPRRSKRERSARRPSDRRPGAAPAPGTPKGTTRRAANVVSPLEPSAPPPEPDPALLERLRAWRRDEARRRGVPSYVIFHDNTLEALAAAHPCDREALARVRGIGPAKLETYSDALLALMG